MRTTALASPAIKWFTRGPAIPGFTLQKATARRQPSGKRAKFLSEWALMFLLALLLRRCR